jgi:SAM-dependent methyltransferase
MEVGVRWINAAADSLKRRAPGFKQLWRARKHIKLLQRELMLLKDRVGTLEKRLADEALHSSALEPMQDPEPWSEPDGPRPQPLTVSYRDVPIFIISFNRVSCLRQLIDWLLSHGYRRIFVVDNASTYPPLLSYYETIERAGMTVIRLGENVGSRALWERNVLQTVGVTSEFVCTDSDVVPAASCPGTVVQHLQGLLNRYPEVPKVGLALRLDSVPTHFRHRAAVLRWEAQFWRRPAARGLMAAEVDTTFALYRPGRGHGQGTKNLRTTYPYLGDHLGWYVDSDHPSEEDRFYAATARMDVTNWSGSELGSVAQGLKEVRPARLMHLGCGKDVFPGWLNVDLHQDDSVRQVDLDTLGNAFADLSDNSFDGFYGCHIFEHLRNSLNLMQELYRLAKPGACTVLRMPYGSSNDAFEDPTHHRPLFEGSFVYYGQPAYSRADYNYTADWAVERVNLVLWPEVFALSPEARLRKLRHSRNTVQEMIVHLRAIKPARPRDLALLTWPTPEFSLSDLDFQAKFDPIDPAPASRDTPHAAQSARSA